MPLDTTNFHPQGPVKSVDLLQFYNLFTGLMTDQPITFSNSITIGGNQGLSTVPLRLYGATGQNTNLIDLYPDHSSAQPGFGFSAVGRFAWGPGGASPQDTFMSRIALQNGHGTDTPGLLITPTLEVVGNVSAAGYAFTNQAAITAPVGTPKLLVVDQDLTVNRDLSVGRNTSITGNASITGNLTLSATSLVSSPINVGTDLHAHILATTLPSIQMESDNGYALISAASNPQLSANAFYRTGTLWNRYNVANPAWLVNLGANDSIIFGRAAPAANPIGSFANLLTITNGGSLIIPPDQSLQWGSASYNIAVAASTSSMYFNDTPGAFIFQSNTAQLMNLLGSTAVSGAGGVVQGTINLFGGGGPAPNAAQAPLAFPQVFGNKINLYDEGGNFRGLAVLSTEYTEVIGSAATFRIRRFNAGSTILMTLTNVGDVSFAGSVTAGPNLASFPLTSYAWNLASDIGAAGSAYTLLINVSIGPGTWLVLGRVTYTSAVAGAPLFNGWIADAATGQFICAASGTIPGAGSIASVSLSGVYASTGTVSLQLIGEGNVAGTFKSLDGIYNRGYATQMQAIRIA